MTREPLRLPEPSGPGGSTLLRPWRSEDAGALHRAWLEPSIAEATAVPADPGVETARTWIAGEHERREQGLALDLVMAEPVDPGGVLGEVGVVVRDPTRGFGELGWWLLPAARGRGIATEAVARLAHHLLSTTTLRRLFALIPEANIASQRVAERAGMTRAGVDRNGNVVWTIDSVEEATKPGATVRI